MLRRIALGDVRPRRLSREGAAASLALLLAVEVLVVCAVNPFTALLLVPATHLCLLAALSDTPRRTLLAATMIAGALACRCWRCCITARGSTSGSRCIATS